MRRARVTWAAVGLACAFGVANAWKPLHVDDPFTFYVARHIADAPLDPFGLEILWWQWPQPVHEYLLPPVLAYWGAGAQVALGTHPFLWKLSMLPWALVFALSLLALARRFAPGCELPLLVATLLSPLLLPSLNYMPDVPALALGLASLALYLRAAERGGGALALAAGVLGGLALQTKYTAFPVLGAVLVHGLLWRRPRPALATVATALALFALWEGAMTLRYGQGMFLGTLAFGTYWSSKSEVPLGLLAQAGPTLAGVALLGLAALGVRARWVAAGGVAVLLAHGVLAVRPLGPALPLALGGATLGVAGAVALRPLRGPRGASLAAWVESHREPLFLALWLAGEALAAVVLSPFPAARRLLGTAVAMTLVIGRAAALPSRRPPLPLWPVAAFQAALGTLYFAVDFLEARAERQVLAAAHRTIRAAAPEAPIWFVGHWGFQFHAERLGMRPVIPDHSRLERGDWLLVPDRVDAQDVALEPDAFRRGLRLVVDDGVPLATLPGFYAGSLPLAHLAGARLVVNGYRALRPVVPPSGWSVAQLVAWAFGARGSQAGWAAPALARELRRAGDPMGRRAAAEALSALGARAGPAGPALAAAARSDPDPAVRAAACRALARIDPGRQPAACARAPGRLPPGGGD